MIYKMNIQEQLYSKNNLNDLSNKLIYFTRDNTVICLHIIIVFCPRAGPSLQTQAPRLQFCPKAGLPLQTQESRLQFS